MNRVGKEAFRSSIGWFVAATVLAVCTPAWGQGAGHGVLLSFSPNRSAAVPLAGQIVAGDVYVFTSPDTGVSRVRFYIDNPSQSGAPYVTEKRAPYDLAGTNADNTAKPFDSTQLADGPHSVTAAMELTAGGVEVVTANFIVDNDIPALVLGADSLSFTLDPGQQDVDAVSIAASNGAGVAYNVVETAGWLTVTGQAGVTPDALMVSVDSAGLAPGTYNATVEVTASGFLSDTFGVTLVVNGSEGGYGLLLSLSPDRSNPIPLANQSVVGNMYVFVSPPTSISRVRFYVDNPGLSGTPVQTEKSAPYDLAGGTAASANPYNTTQIGDGQHVLSALIEISGGGSVVLHSDFFVQNNQPGLVFSPQSLTFTLEPGQADGQDVLLSTSNGGPAAFQIIENLEWLEVTPSSGGTAATLSVNVDTTTLTPGSHGANVQATAVGYLPATLSITLNVTSGSGGPGYNLLVSSQPDRSNPFPLAGSVLAGNAYIFTSPDAGVSRVRFWLDNPSMAGTPRQTEKSAPYDFAGTNGGAAAPFNTATIADGPHTVTAAIELSAGGTEVVHADFTVNNDVPRLVYSPGSVSFSLDPGESALNVVNLSATNGAAADYTITPTAAAPWLNVQLASGVTPASINLTANATGLASGTYSTSLLAESTSGLLDATLDVTLTVGTAGTCYPLTCAEILVDLPYPLDFSSNHGGVVDRNGVGTGFTYVDLPSNGTGYVPANLEMMTAQGVLEITTTAGQMSRTTNSQDNALGVGIDAPSQVNIVRTTVVNVPAGTGGFEQAGLWFGNDERNYIKLVVISKPEGMAVEMSMEQNDARIGLRKSGVLNLVGMDVTLSMVADPTDRTVVGSYQIGGGAPITFTELTAPPEFFSFDAAGINPEIGTRTFAGIFASHVDASPMVYRFTQFDAIGIPFPPSGSGFSFDRTSHPVTKPTSMVWGPDERLYVLELFGTIHALTYDASKQVIDDEVISALVSSLGPRLSLGITVDPSSTPMNVILWTSSSSPSLDNGAPNSGIITRISGPNFSTVEHVITGLPRAIANHATNSIHFGPDGRLYIAQGGNTGAGSPNTANTEFGAMQEQPLSAALLAADVYAPGFDGSCHNASDIFGPPPCDVQTYSTGLRNMYDFVFHSNGSMYGPENGLGVVGTYPPSPTPPCLGFGDVNLHYPGSQPDTLLRLQQGKYYGHPNPYRSECVFKDGSYQGVAPLPNYQAPMFVLGNNKSADGAIEYTADNFCGRLRGDLLITNYSVGDDITRVTLSADGMSVLDASSLVSGFNDPLPLAMSPDGTIYVGEFGGDLVTALKPVEFGCWETVAAMPQAVLDAGGAALDGKLYVVGGETATGHVATLHVYDAAGNAWSTGANRPGTAVEDAMAVGHNGKLYVFGGATDSFSGAINAVHAYDPIGNSWQALAPMPTARSGAAVGVVNGLIYVTGGMDDNGASLDVVEVYNPASNTWSTAAPMLTRRDAVRGAGLNGKFYVFGGRIRNADGTTVDPTLATAESYDPGSNTWSFIQAMPTGRRSMVVGRVDGKALVMGGEATSTGGSFEENEEYDPVTNLWRPVEPMATPRHGAVAGTINNRIYVAGGGPAGGTSFTAATEVFSYVGGTGP